MQAIGTAYSDLRSRSQILDQVESSLPVAATTTSEDLSLSWLVDLYSSQTR